MAHQWARQHDVRHENTLRGRLAEAEPDHGQVAYPAHLRPARTVPAGGADALGGVAGRRSRGLAAIIWNSGAISCQTPSRRRGARARAICLDYTPFVGAEEQLPGVAARRAADRSGAMQDGEDGPRRIERLHAVRVPSTAGWCGERRNVPASRKAGPAPSASARFARAAGAA